ncbi:Ytp1p NDAI_0F03880 [Naumovozyma dairenensis CBS 421]|uniref:Protein YTP1-like C-terminal domain-containing protein n=1 Tax=Naumovozyma dairenensis (strain ATCC 10597 / BCRC 20456 / CBS 421 / NBRC 0211 / NRRL Y-12639) TaxID=1071378 RepID=G0WD45_NAUDC|nr:hypothetical protein NDAI_0F03880 [Naumovozyma dairenensis CBS 421]CCD25706.1 hypothetical protein NDAI_0F03880 [Naumovozyma dairenensis CBS 421]
MMMHMGGDPNVTYTRPDIIYAGSRTTHWLFTVALSFLLPSIYTVLTFAGRLKSSLFFQIIAGIYSIIEVCFLSFADNSGIENITSRVMGIILCILIWLSIFIGALTSGTSFLIKNKKLEKFVSNTGETKLTYVHRGMSFASVLLGWLKVCMAPVAMFGFCRDNHTGQCLAHGIMGTAFVWYGFVYSFALVIPRITKSQETSYSQDHIDSWVMCIWGIVNTFTEHRWGREDWFTHDYQHTAMGIIWWAGGILGIFLSRNGKRTFVPSLLIVITGWAMSQHHQHLEVSTNVHSFFGTVLMIGGMLRIVEICIILRDKKYLDQILSFQYLSPFCLVSAGLLFMGATEEQMILVLRLGADHSSYIMVVMSGAFLVFFWMQLCLNTYLHLVQREQIGFLDTYPTLLNAQQRQDQDENDETFELERDVSESLDI